MMNKFYLLIIVFFNISFSEYLDIQYASFSYTIGGSYGSCVKFKKSEHNFSDFEACNCAWAANTSNYSNCYDLYYNPQTKIIKYNLSEGADYIYRDFSSDYTCHIYNEEIQMNECSAINEPECGIDDSCEWVEDVENGWCGSFNNNSSACNNIDSCSYTTCQQECNWSGSAECESYPGCSYSYLTYSCSGTTTVPCCSGGSYQIDNSYCEEVSFIPGDANGDNTLNVADIVLIVDFILNSEYDEYSDINQDGILNVIDVVELVNRILSN